LVVRIKQDLREFVALTVPQKRTNDAAQEDVYSDWQEELSGAPKLMATVGNTKLMATLTSTLKADYMTAAEAVKDALR
jgi:hypothetical protein